MWAEGRAQGKRCTMKMNVYFERDQYINWRCKLKVVKVIKAIEIVGRGVCRSMGGSERFWEVLQGFWDEGNWWG
jgi:hypothetical protein